MTDMSRFSRSGRGPGPACRGRRGRHVACKSGPDDELATMRARAAGDGGRGLWRRHARLEREGGGTAGTAGQSGSGGAAGGQATVSEADAARVRAETRCRLLFECCDPAGDHGAVDLPVYEFDTEDACVARFQAYYQGVHDEARAAGLTYDPACLGFEVAGERAFGCGPGPYQEWCVTSDIYRGDVAEGGGCTSNIAGYFSDCQKGLTCAAVESYSGVCLRFSGQDGPQRQYVQVEIGEPCDLYAQCKLGASCSPDTHTCVPGLSVGADCHGGVCAVGSYCKSFTCTPLLSEGAPCEILSCGAGTYCPFSEQDASLRICTRSQADGEACTRGSLSCASGWCACVCAPPPPNVCLWWVPEQG